MELNNLIAFLNAHLVIWIKINNRRKREVLRIAAAASGLLTLLQWDIVSQRAVKTDVRQLRQLRSFTAKKFRSCSTVDNSSKPEVGQLVSGIFVSCCIANVN